MITFIKCPNCSHAGFASALLPRFLVCSRCGQSTLVTAGEPVRSSIRVREERVVSTRPGKGTTLSRRAARSAGRLPLKPGALEWLPS